jgi:hypothetical protein
LAFNQYLPNSIPPGGYTGQVEATDQSGRIIQCVQFNFTIA